MPGLTRHPATACQPLPDWIAGQARNDTFEARNDTFEARNDTFEAGNDTFEGRSR
ncbi:MAG TPA: hypothetical protein VGF26_19865 [Ramlibacter sp.]